MGWLRERLTREMARQLGRPSGLPGRLLVRGLNRGNRKMIDAAAAALGEGSGLALADVGFGGGIGLRILLDRPGTSRVEGIDISPTAIRTAERKFASEIRTGRLNVHCASLEAMPVAAQSLDGLITVNTIYFVDDLESALAEVGRVLRPAGRAAIAIGDPEGMANLPFTAHGFRLRSLAELEAALTQCGLSLVDHRRVGAEDRSAHVLVAAHA